MTSPSHLLSLHLPPYILLPSSLARVQRPLTPRARLPGDCSTPEATGRRSPRPSTLMPPPVPPRTPSYSHPSCPPRAPSCPRRDAPPDAGLRATRTRHPPEAAPTADADRDSHQNGRERGDGHLHSFSQIEPARAYAQHLVATRLLDCLHDPAGQPSRMQGIRPRAL